MINDQIIRAIADAKDTDPMALDLALENWIDTDAIQALQRHDTTDWVLRFEIPDHSVTVTGDNEILVDGRKERMFSSTEP